MSRKENYSKIEKMIGENENFLIVSHAHPDGDGIGSTLALGMALEKLGKKVVMYNEDDVPENLEFLPGAKKMTSRLDGSERYDVSIMVDCSQPERAGKDFPPPERRGRLVCVDHHMGKCEGAEVECLDEDAASTGEVVYNILKRLGVEVNSELATQILTTLIVDTGSFKYSNTTPHTLALASELVARGASTWNINRNLEERVKPAQLRLLSAALDTIEYFLDGRLSMMVLTNQMFRHADASVEMAEEFINFPRSIDSVDVAVLLRQKGKGAYKVSFRSKDSVDVAKLAARFNGGGHEHAAGCDIEGSLGTVKQVIIKAVKEALS